MNVAIIDDLPQDRQKIHDYLNQYFSGNYSELPYTIHEYVNGEDFLKNFTANTYDIIFMDHFMNDLTGLETARMIRKADEDVVLIYTTTSSDFAIDCYSVRASGYLLKPILYETFFETLQLLNLEKLKDREFIEIGSGNNRDRVLLKNIIYCDISGHYTQIHTINLGLKRMRMPFANFVKMLEPYPEFFLCYRGCMINMNMVVRVDDLNFFMINRERIPFRQKEQVRIQKIYYDFLFRKVRCREYDDNWYPGNSSLRID